MKEKKKTGAWIRLIVFSFLALILITILISGIRKGGMNIPFLSFSSFQYAAADQYVSVIQDERLARCHGSDGRFKNDVDRPV